VRVWSDEHPLHQLLRFQRGAHSGKDRCPPSAPPLRSRPRLPAFSMALAVQRSRRSLHRRLRRALLRL